MFLLFKLLQSLNSNQIIMLILKWGRFSLVFAICFAAPKYVAAQALPFAPTPILDTLCSPAFWGRGYERQGAQRAAAWLEKRLDGLGLQADTLLGSSASFVRPHVSFGPKVIAQVGGKRQELGIAYLPDAESRSVRRRFGSSYRVWRPDSLGFLAANTGHTWPKKKAIVVPVAWYKALKASRTPISIPADQPLVLLHTKLPAHTIGQEVLPFPLMHALASGGYDDGAKLKLRWETKLVPAMACKNVVRVVRGTAVPDSVLIVCAHYDHLGGMGKSAYFPGANDNASGIAMLLELAAHTARQPLRYTVAFIAFDGEEAGLLGSTHFVRTHVAALAKLRFVLNLDLLGSGEDGATLVNAPAVQPDFEMLKALNETQHLLPTLRPRRNAPNSDHYPFAMAGYPALFMYLQGPYAEYHSVGDKPAGLSLAGFEPTFRLLNAFLRGLSKTD